MAPRYIRRRPVAARPRAAGSSSSALARVHSEAAYALAKLQRRKRMNVLTRMGLLKGKTADQPLDEVEKKMLDHELAIARDLQANILPKQLPGIPGFEVAAYYRSSREVGGDYYDFIPVDDAHLGIVIADVSGKGIPGSLVVSETRVLIRSNAPGTRSPADVLKRVNRFLYQDIIRGMFVTVFYIVLDVKNRQITMTSAGHNPMLYYRAQNQSCYLLNPSGIALGIDRGPLFDATVKEQRLKMAVGDRLVLYTDGVIDTFDPEKVAYGIERFSAFVKNNGEMISSEFVKTIVADLEGYQAGGPQHDDITLVTIRAVAANSPHDTTFENLL